MRYLGYLTMAVFSLALAARASGELYTDSVEYKQGDTVLEGYLAYDDSFPGKRAGILVVHEWWGLNDYIRQRAQQLARMGYIVFAVDMYGKGVRPKTVEEAAKQSSIYNNDRALMRERARAGLDVLRDVQLTDRARIVAIGYCFGGGVVLELARSGANLRGVVSFHGTLGTPHPEDASNIKGAVLVMQGALDPYVTGKDLAAFEEEMTKGGVDWQAVIYGGAVHSFTNPASGDDPSKGVAYNEKADRRSWKAMKDFFGEVLK
jgi:dienelactone hydrolase